MATFQNRISKVLPEGYYLSLPGGDNLPRAYGANKSFGLPNDSIEQDHRERSDYGVQEGIIISVHEFVNFFVRLANLLKKVRFFAPRRQRNLPVYLLQQIRETQASVPVTVNDGSILAVEELEDVTVFCKLSFHGQLGYRIPHAAEPV
ncbi:MAG: hypothetical protein M3495_19935 [Pseudomonadota bacterium]|nr:hypothetical protein [Gammaproteobacteria bacterium]MDQ3583727.1 hypothetical protein [Pseudomonadota bacterium]